MCEQSYKMIKIFQRTESLCTNVWIHAHVENWNRLCAGKKNTFHFLVVCQSVLKSAPYSPPLYVQYRAFVSVCHEFSIVEYVSTVCSLSVSLECSSAPGVREPHTSTPESSLHSGHSAHRLAAAVISARGAYCTCLYY